MTLVHFLSGAVSFGFALAALFFLRFWRDSRDSLFVYFAMAFALLALGQAVVTFSATFVEDRSWAYLIRLAGFGMLLLGIARKNRSAR